MQIHFYSGPGRCSLPQSFIGGYHPSLGTGPSISCGDPHRIKSFLVTPYVFTTYERATAYLRKNPNVCSYYLVRLQPGAEAEEVCAGIRQRVPELDAFPRHVYSRISANYWLTRSGLGISFGAATLIGLFVGFVMVAQTLYALVLNRLTEFGTLKAIGATERQIYRILFLQATVMGVVFQRFNLIRGLTALENVCVPQVLRGVSALGPIPAAIPS